MYKYLYVPICRTIYIYYVYYVHNAYIICIWIWVGQRRTGGFNFVKRVYYFY